MPRGTTVKRMTLIELTYFNEVAKTRNFTAAASNLYISQPSLSYSIQQLEKELDVPLFIRHKNKQIELTPYGEALLPYAQMALTDISKAYDAVKELSDPLSGTVRIEFFWSLSTTLIPSFLKQYKADNPDSNIKMEFIVDHSWTDLEQALLSGKTDLVISAGELGGECASSCIAYQKLMAYVPVENRLAAQEFIEPDDLRGEKIIAFSAGSNMDQAVKKIYKQNGIPVDFKYASDWCSQILQVSVNGNIGLNIDHAVTTPLVKKIPIKADNNLLNIYISWPANRKITASAMFVRDYLIELSKRTPAEFRTF